MTSILSNPETFKEKLHNLMNTTNSDWWYLPSMNLITNEPRDWVKHQQTVEAYQVEEGQMVKVTITNGGNVLWIIPIQQ